MKRYPPGSVARGAMRAHPVFRPAELSKRTRSGNEPATCTFAVEVLVHGSTRASIQVPIKDRGCPVAGTANDTARHPTREARRTWSEDRNRTPRLRFMVTVRSDHHHR